MLKTGWQANQEIKINLKRTFSVLYNYWPGHVVMVRPSNIGVNSALKRAYIRASETALTLKAPSATKVVCFSRLLKCLRSLYGKQCGPRLDCSWAVWSGSTLFASILNSSVLLGNYLQQTTSADDISRYIFLGALRVKSAYRSSIKAPTKTHQLKSSAANKCITLLTKLSVEANSVDPDQPATGAVWSGSTLFVKDSAETFQQTTKPGDFCCD